MKRAYFRDLMIGKVMNRRSKQKGRSRRPTFMRLAGVVDGQPDLSTRKGFSSGTERGSRADDKASEVATGDRKKQG